MVESEREREALKWKALARKRDACRKRKRRGGRASEREWAPIRLLFSGGGGGGRAARGGLQGSHERRRGRTKKAPDLQLKDLVGALRRRRRRSGCGLKESRLVIVVAFASFGRIGELGQKISSHSD